jgi:hypothetical protein
MNNTTIIFQYAGWQMGIPRMGYNHPQSISIIPYIEQAKHIS